MKRGVLISNHKIFKGQYGLDLIATTGVRPDCRTIEVPCLRGSRLFHRICEWPDLAIFIEEGKC